MTDKEKLEAMFTASEIYFEYDDMGHLEASVDDYFVVYIFDACGQLMDIEVERV